MTRVMIDHYGTAPLRRALFTLALFLLAPTSAGAFFGQSPTTAIPALDRSGADQAGTFQLAQSSASLAEQSIRIDRLEEQMRQLNGRIEEMTWQIQQLQERLRKAQEDADFRFKEMESGKPAKRSDIAPPDTPEDAPGADLAGADDPSVAAAREAVDDAGATQGELPNGFSIDAEETLGAPPRVLGSVPGTPLPGGEVPDVPAGVAPPLEGGAGGPLDLSAIARGEATPTGPTPPREVGLPGVGTPAAGGTGVIVSNAAPTPVTRSTAMPAPRIGTPAGGGAPSETEMTAVMQPQDPKEAYDRAYGYIVEGNYSMAEMGFKQFIADNPKSALIGNAHFWLGESYFARNQFREAADAFLTTYRDHPRSPKAVESLLKLGLSLEGLGEKEAACATYGELQKKFPNASAPLLNKVVEQQSKNGC